MKDWSYYKTVSIPYPDRNAIRGEMINEINQNRLTADERKAELNAVSARVSDWFKEAIKPYNEEIKNLEEEFWADCREEFGYDQYLNEEAVKVLEHQAYEDGHSAGFPEIYACLSSLSDLAEKLTGGNRFYVALQILVSKARECAKNKLSKELDAIEKFM